MGHCALSRRTLLFGASLSTVPLMVMLHFVMNSTSIKPTSSRKADAITSNHPLEGEIQLLVTTMPPLNGDSNVRLPKSNTEEEILLVMFTTFKNISEKLFIYNNTINNWSAFGPKIKPVLFTVPFQGVVEEMAQSKGWDTHPCPRLNKYGTPFLKDMYFEMYKQYRATFYGFCNGDILFDTGLVQTLEGVKEYLKRGDFNSSITVGRRWNYQMKNASFYANDPIWHPHKVKTLANKKNASLFRTDAEDFFIVNENYPWHGIKDVVIGRPGYDNYLLARSIQMSVPSIEATNTIACVHQTGHDGNSAGAKHADGRYNKDVIGKFNYYAGLSDRSWFSTKRDYLQHVFLVPQRWQPPTTLAPNITTRNERAGAVVL